MSLYCAKRTIIAAGMLFAVAVAVTFAAERSPETPTDVNGMVVIDEKTPLRTYLVYRTPMVVGKDGKVRIATYRKQIGRNKFKSLPYPEFESLSPSAGWRGAEFNDSTWVTRTVPVEAETKLGSMNAKFVMHWATRSSMVCVRGKFHVNDPKGVHELKLDVEYVGGVAIYLNGKEVRRANLPEGELTPATLAENYPEDLYVDKAGNYLQPERLSFKHSRASKFAKSEAEAGTNRANYARRYRRVSGVSIDSRLLRKGENVLALLICRAPVNESATRAKIVPVYGRRLKRSIYPYAGLKSLRLTAKQGSRLRPNCGRPRGVRLWNCMPLETVTSRSLGDGASALKPVKVYAARNGVFSGRIVVSSGSAITGLKAGVSELMHEKGGVKLSGEQIVLRLAAAAKSGESWMNDLSRYDALLEKIPDRIDVVKVPLERRGTPVPTGAVAPLWVTVRVPTDAKPGVYRGKVSVEAAGLPKTEVPLEVTVYDWKLADPADFRVRNLAVMSPENVAMYYKVPFWSERHLELVGQCLKLMKEAGSRNVEIELATDYHGQPGNSQTLVRWIKNGKNGYKHDFSILDKYLEMVKKSVGRPLPLRINCWPTITGGKKSKLLEGVATEVTLLDPKTGKLERLNQPYPGSEESYRFWKPVVDGVRERIRKYGWEDVASMGHQAYCWSPTPKMVDVCHRIWPDAVWSYTAHNGTLGRKWKGSNGAAMLIRYSECVWTQGSLEPRGARQLVGRENQNLVWNSASRGKHGEDHPVARMRQLPEEMILRGHDGVGQLGAGLFPLKSGRAGRYYALGHTRGGLGPEASTRNILAPGPKGPVATERFEMFREGVQLCEAVIYLEKALLAKMISGDLAKRVDAYLNARGQAHVEGWWAGQCERDRQLLELAAEVARATGR
jgi:hypothetical protein